jgi:hypothetical protein
MSNQYEENDQIYDEPAPQQVFMSYSDREKYRKMKLLVIVAVSIIVIVSAAYILGVLIPRIIMWATPPSPPPTCNFSVIYVGTGIAPTQEITPGILLSVGSNNGFIALDAGSLVRGVSTFITNVWKCV